jgi:hypothetical protein
MKNIINAYYDQKNFTIEMRQIHKGNLYTATNNIYAREDNWTYLYYVDHLVSGDMAIIYNREFRTLRGLITFLRKNGVEISVK